MQWPWRSALQFGFKEPGSTKGPSCCPWTPTTCLHRGHGLCQRLKGDKVTWSMVGVGVLPRGNLLSQARTQEAPSSVLPAPLLLHTCLVA